MERSKRDLESIVNAQKEQLSRYETRLKDVVTAYKGLLKEKEALEASLTAFRNDNLTKSSSSATSPTDDHKKDFNSTENNNNNNNNNNKKLSSINNNESTTTTTSSAVDLQMQIATVMNSLATLSAEKSRMEASFQADKKQLRQDLIGKDKQIKELNEKLHMQMTNGQTDLETVKTKLIVERHERESDINDHMIRIRELQKLLTDERNLKANLEMQLHNLKTQFVTQTDRNDSVQEITNLHDELEQMKRKYKELQNKCSDSDGGVNNNNNNKNNNNNTTTNQLHHLKQLQSEIVQLKQQHALALRAEQKRANFAEEQIKKLSFVHEERVVNLETRLAELSTTVGAYDRYRQHDKETILRLKEQIAQLNADHNDVNNASNNQPPIDEHNRISEQQLHSSIINDPHKLWNVPELIEEITKLKKILVLENEKLTIPNDLTKLFSSIHSDHKLCIAEQNKLQLDYDKMKSEFDSLTSTIDIQKSHIRTLQDKIKVLNLNIDEQEQELRKKYTEHTMELKTERNKWKEIISGMEMDFRSKIAELEQSLQKQRERSLLLLEEKESEIKTLKTSFEIFLPTNSSITSSSTIYNPQEQHYQETKPHRLTNEINDEIILDENGDVIPIQKQKLSSVHLNTVLNPMVSTATNGESNNNNKKNTKHSSIGIVTNDQSYHMLHYVQELARKDVEVTQLRKGKYAAETSLRQAIQDKITSQEELHDKIIALEEQVDRLERCKSREGANLEYLKNVILSFLASNDKDNKRHMVNAIAAVLKFSPAEFNIINNYFTNNKREIKK